MSDYAALVERAQSSDPAQRRAAFDQLVGQFQGAAYRQAYAILGDAQLAEDVTQDAFLSAYRNIDQLRDPLAFPGWLRRIVQTQCNRVLRRSALDEEPLEARWDLESGTPPVEALIEASELTASLRSAVQDLPHHERVVTEGFYLRGESQKEVAERLGIPLTTVKKRLQYARGRLRSFMAELSLLIDEPIDLLPGRNTRRDGSA
jgi:RNA polymerase sigma factor (sigma-70 family)